MNKEKMEKDISIGLITATNEEYQSIYELLTKQSTDSNIDSNIETKAILKETKDKIPSIPFPYFIHNFDFISNDKIYKIKLIIIKSGFGKLNAVSASTFLLERYKIDIIINFGACGSLSKKNKDIKPEEIQLGDFVLPSIIYESSYIAFKENKNSENSGNFNEKKTFIGLNKIESLIHKEIIQKYYFVKEVKAFSSDMDIDSSEKRNFIKKFFKADICDWESFAIRKTAHLWKIPSIIFRVVSDFADESFLEDYKRNLNTILNKGAKFLINELLPIACKIYISELNLKR